MAGKALQALALVVAVLQLVLATPLPYPLSTRGSQIVGPDGVAVRLVGVGINTQLDPFSQDYQLNYKTVFDLLAQQGLNTVRITTIDSQIIQNSIIPRLWYQTNPDLEGLGARDAYKKLVDYGTSVGLKFVIESHENEVSGFGNQQNGLWYDVGGASDGSDGAGNPGTVSDSDFLNGWKIRAELFKGHQGVIGYDIRNEPQAYGICTWGDNDFNHDIRAMYERVGNAIHEIDPDKLIICEGPQYYSDSFGNVGNAAPWGDLSIAGQVPVQLNVPNKVVYSIHNYPSEVAGYTPDSGAAAVRQWNNIYGYLISQNIAPVWVGECGTNMQTADAQAWGDTFVSWMNGEQGANGGPTFGPNDQAVSWSWWELKPVLSGPNNFGILDRSGGVDQQQKNYWGQMMPKTLGTPPPPTQPPTHAPTHAPTPPPTHGPTSPCGATVTDSSSLLVDSQGNTWGIEDGKVVENGNSDDRTGNVIRLAYVNGQLWQENSANMWWYSDNTGAWQPELGTDVSPLNLCPTQPPTPKPTQPPTPKPTQPPTPKPTQPPTPKPTQPPTPKPTQPPTPKPTLPPTPKPTLPPTPKPTNAPTTAPTPSPCGATVAAGSSAVLVDAQHNKWTITSSNQVALNGNALGNTQRVTMIAIVNGQLWQENADNNWWEYVSGAWKPDDGTPIPPLDQCVSPCGTQVNAGTGGEILDSQGNTWTITSSGLVAKNGNADSSTANVIALKYVDDVLWQENNQHLWWSMSNGAWLPTYGTDAIPQC